MEHSFETKTEVMTEWGLSLDAVYKVAITFFKEKDGTKALTTSYADRLHLLALMKQASLGKYSSSASPASGFFDLVGNHRREAWQALGDLSKQEAKTQFVDSLNKLCPLFAHVVQAHKLEKEEEERKKSAELDMLKRKQEEEAKKLQEQLQAPYESMLRAALNQQNYSQFKMYAQLQCPDNEQKQEELVKYLQEQHILQYMQQLYNQQQSNQQNQQPNQQNQQPNQQNQQPNQQNQQPNQQNQQPNQQNQQLNQQNQQPNQPTQQPPNQQQSTQNNGPSNLPSLQHLLEARAVQNSLEKKVVQQSQEATSQQLQSNKETIGELKPKPGQEGTKGQKGTPHDFKVVPNGDLVQKEPNQCATITSEPEWWIRSDVANFKESLRTDTESMVVAGPREAVTIRMHTNSNGSSLYWEFATDDYDIGFGLSFEWAKEPTSNGDVSTTCADTTKADSSQEVSPTKVQEIIPVKRVNSNKEVQCGSHKYPGVGWYLLTFDNSFSFWRAKNVYFRFFYA